MPKYGTCGKTVCEEQKAENPFVLSKRSNANLEGVHPDLIAVVKKAIQLTKVDFVVTEGLRSMKRQKQLKAKGASKTLKSRHLTGHAVDLAALVDGEIRWDWPLYHKLADAMFAAADDIGVQLEWGGNWKSFPDGPHFQLSWFKYPPK